MTVTMLLIGLLIVQAVIPEIVGIFMLPKPTPKPAQPKLTAAQEKEKRVRKSRKEFLPDGTVHLVHTIKNTGLISAGKRIEIYDTDDNLLWTGEDKDKPYNYLVWSDNFGLTGRGRGRGGIGVRHMNQMQMINPDFSQTLIVPVVSSQRKIVQRWRYEPKQRLFVGFDFDGRQIGYAGADGFAKTKTQTRPFGQFQFFTAWSPKDSYSPVLLWQTDHQLYELNFEKHSIEMLFDTQGQDIALIAMNNWRNISNDYPEYRPAICIRTKSGDRHLLLGDPTQRLVLKTPRQWNPHQYYVNIAAIGDRIFIKYAGIEGEPATDDPRRLVEWFKEHRYKPITHWTELYLVDNRGNLESINRFEWIRPPWPKAAVKQGIVDWRLRTKTYVTALSSPLFSLAWRWYYKDVATWSYSYQPLNSVIAKIITYAVPTNKKLNWILGILMVAAVFWHAWPRRTSWARLVFWLAFVAAFNLAGFLTYLAMNHSTMIRCGACGKRRGLEMPDCPACKAPLPLPQQRNVDLMLVNSV